MTGIAVRVAQALSVSAVLTAVVAAVLAVLSRRVRPHDGALWHAIFATLAGASMVAPLAALLPPLLNVVVIAVPYGAGLPAGVRAAGPGPWSMLGAAAYFGGVAVLFIRLAGGVGRVVNLRRGSRALEPYESARLRRVAPGAEALCRVHDRAQSPAAVGWRRPWILLPPAWMLWSDERIAAVLRHERAHIVRRDALWHLLAAVQQAIYWPSPAAWLITRRTRYFAELASDRAGAGADPVGYARHLVATAEEVRLGVAAGALSPGAVDELEARVDALLSDDRPLPAARPLVRIAAAALAILVVVVPMTVRLGTSLPSHAGAGMHDERHAARHGDLGYR